MFVLAGFQYYFRLLFSTSTAFFAHFRKPKHNIHISKCAQQSGVKTKPERSMADRKYSFLLKRRREKFQSQIPYFLLRKESLVCRGQKKSILPFRSRKSANQRETFILGLRFYKIFSHIFVKKYIIE